MYYHSIFLIKTDFVVAENFEEVILWSLKK
jgi:hypothetical protein